MPPRPPRHTHGKAAARHGGGAVCVALTTLPLAGRAAALAPPAGLSAAVQNAVWEKELAAYNVAWTTPSEESKGSMPLAGGNLALNVWVEKGAVCFLVGSPNSFDVNGMQVKLGLVRLTFSPAVFTQDFKQELNLGRSEIVIHGETASGAPVSVTLWCAVDKPVVHVKTTSGQPVEVTATYETWSGFEAKETPDDLQWSQRLPSPNPRLKNDLRNQGMTEFASKVPDPLSGLIKGGRLSATGLVAAGTGEATFNGLKTRTCAMKTATPVRDLDLCITLRMEQDKSPEVWAEQLDRAAKDAAKTGAADRATALAWWNEFWGRSHIAINPGEGPFDKGWLTARNYQLARYQLAGNRTGRAMTLFNGGLFPCEGNPDSRMWDGCQFMAQNQRPMAWSLLKTGDYDLLKVSLDFYRDRTEINRLHAKKFWGVDDAVVYSEALGLFGLDAIGTTPDGRCSPAHLHYHYTSGMEFALIMLEYGRFTDRDITDYLAPAQGIIRYYDQFYQKTLKAKTGKPLDENGKLVIYPTDACEPFHGCTNNTDVICGLEALSQALLDLPPKYLKPEIREYIKSFQTRIPPLTIAETKEGKKYVAAAKSYEWVFYNGNMDFPNMYVLFPFNKFFLGRPDNGAGIELANNTWEYGAIRPNVQRQARCWYQSSINLARLGRTADAKAFTLKKFVENPSLRFPSFWTNYGFCHAPDTDHAATAMIGLQEMIMQTDGHRILLGAAWPAEWNADFKLHAPYETVVEGRVVDGKVVVDKVTPESRRKDIEIYPLKAAPPAPVSEGKPATASSTYGGGYEAGKAFDGDPGTRWASRSGKQGWLEVDLGKPTEVSRVVIDELSYERVSKFAIEAKQADGSWKKLAEGGTIGAGKEIRFAPVKARVLRLNILDCSAEAPTIDEMRWYAK